MSSGPSSNAFCNPLAKAYTESYIRAGAVSINCKIEFQNKSGEKSVQSNLTLVAKKIRDNSPLEKKM